MAKIRKKKKLKVKARTTTKELPKNFFSVFKKEALLDATVRTKEFAKELSKEAKATIRKQKFKWLPLDPAYVKKKQKEGLDTRIFMATKEYVNKGIGHYEKGGYSFVGPKPGIHKPSGLTYVRLARILEFGTWYIAARPLWRPLLSNALRKSKLFKKQYAAARRRALNKQVKKAKVKKRKV